MEAITAFMESFDIAKFLPELGKLISDLRFWIGLFSLAGPAVMLVLGLCYFFLPTKEANHHIGFRTYFGMGSPAAWRFAQRRAGLLFMIGGGVLAAASVVVVILFGKADPMKLALITLILLIVQALTVFGLWLAMQIILMKRFDKNGNEKSRG